MNNPGRFALELITTLVVATVLSLLYAVVALFIIGNVGTVTNDAGMWVSSSSSIIFGLVVGYKLNTLVRQHGVKQAKKKK